MRVAKDLPASSTRSPDGKPRQFFGVDKRAFARACELGLNPAIAYLVLARGTGADQRTTAWSAHAIEKHAGISRARAAEVIEILIEDSMVQKIEASLVQKAEGRPRPRYRILPGEEMPRPDGLPPLLSQPERRVFERGLLAPAPMSERKLSILGGASVADIAKKLAKMGYVRLRSGRYQAVPSPTPVFQPDWIWLPNALVDAPDAGDSPLALLRERRDLELLRLLVSLYHAQHLRDYGGIDWRQIRIGFERVMVADSEGRVILGFRIGPESASNDFLGPFLMTSEASWWRKASVRMIMQARSTCCLVSSICSVRLACWNWCRI